MKEKDLSMTRHIFLAILLRLSDLPMETERLMSF